MDTTFLGGCSRSLSQGKESLAFLNKSLPFLRLLFRELRLIRNGEIIIVKIRFRYVGREREFYGSILVNERIEISIEVISLDVQT